MEYVGRKSNFFTVHLENLTKALSGGKKAGLGIPSWDKAVMQMKIKMTVPFQA